MKTIKKRIQLVNITLIILILFQSCRVYHKENVSLDKAVAEQKRVKIKMNDGLKLKLKRIVLDSGQYYGIKKIKGEISRTLIETGNIESLRLHNKTMSIIYGIVIGAVALVVGTTVLFLAAWSGPDIAVGMTLY